MAGSTITVSGLGRKVFMALVLFLFEKSFNAVALWLFMLFAVALNHDKHVLAGLFAIAGIAATCVSAKKAE